MAKKAVTEGFPFGDGVLVFKVAGKMFALVAIEEIPLRVNLKCDPEKAIELREQYASVIPGYHMNKQLWNTVIMEGEVPDNEFFKWIDDSYNLIVASLTKKKRVEFGMDA
jgi:predicted DNA-binding protein (MmcQ/YjbR family)